MIRYRIIVLFIAATVIFGCSSASFQKTDNGIVVTVNSQTGTGAKKIRLQVINQNIIHVSATPENSFADPQSLITVPTPSNKTKWDAYQKGDSVLLKTATTTAIIHVQSGQIKLPSLRVRSTER
jgi:alpha-D-xyloside xylohydrolase